MNKKILFLLFSSCIFFAIAVLGTFSSCKKATPGKAIVTVQDSTGKALQGASVHLNCQQLAGCTVDVTLTTDASGKVTFERKLPAILKADATYVSGGVTMTGSKSVTFEDNKTDEQTVTVK